MGYSDKGTAAAKAVCKARDKAMVIGGIELYEKTGGKSGTYRRSDAVR